mmetsp:Transcript_32658/g.82892  ORF Transcript_32658/g.82892 Transcript_32658/m.82892 type:complete len:203 (+) Transcript_32658:974-1582(+)
MYGCTNSRPTLQTRALTATCAHKGRIRWLPEPAARSRCPLPVSCGAIGGSAPQSAAGTFPSVLLAYVIGPATFSPYVIAPTASRRPGGLPIMGKIGLLRKHASSEAPKRSSAVTSTSLSAPGDSDFCFVAASHASSAMVFAPATPPRADTTRRDWSSQATGEGLCQEPLTFWQGGSHQWDFDRTTKSAAELAKSWSTEGHGL